MTAVLRFVDSIQASPTVRLDLNSSTAWKAQFEGTRFGVPPMKRSVTSSLLRDGEWVGASTYGNRELELVLELRSATDDAASTQLQLLQRELDRPTNLLQYTPDGVTNTVFFRTFRTSPESVRFDWTRKQATVIILAEPFALGLREDLSPITVNNNPAAGSNGLFADLTGIKGDFATPLFIEYADGGGGLTRSGFAVGVRTGASPYPNRFYQAESMNQHTDTTTGADAAMSGGSRSRCTFATQTALTHRLSGGVPSLTVPAGAENWGVYRVFARVAQTVAGDVINMAVKIDGGDYNKPIQIKSQTQAQLVDLGVVDATAGLTTTGGFAVAEYRIEAQNALMIAAQRVSGSGSLDIDYLVFVPADECFGAWTAFGDAALAGYLAVIDGPNDAAYIATTLSGGAPGRVRGAGVAITGRLPVVRPGDNRLVIVESTKGGTAPTTNSLTTSISMTIRYWPRYLLVRPVGT
jgi:hypothetical protein